MSKPKSAPYFHSCTRLRRWFVRKGTLNMATGETTFDVEPGEWKEGECSTPLFGDRPAIGICQGCERGWFVPTNYPIGEDPRVKERPAVILTEHGARTRIPTLAAGTRLTVDHFSRVIPDGQLMAHVIEGANRWSLGESDYAPASRPAVYHGRRRGHDSAEVTFTDANQTSRPLPIRLDLANHSPTGFEWGYGGSGPAQLALALCVHALDGDVARARAVYMDYKTAVVARLAGDDWRLTNDQVLLSVLSIEGGRRPAEAR